MRRLILTAALASAALLTAPSARAQASYVDDILPILKRSCQGCHNPAEPAAELSVVSHADLLKGGKSGPAVKPGKPDESLLYTLVIGDDPAMPMGGDPLPPEETDLLKRWILDGAKDDALPPEEQPVFEPPVYTAAPVITALAYAPDGKTIAVSGFSETLILSADGAKRLHRLVGEARRIESIAYSEKGDVLCVGAGSPAQFGQAQLWDPKTGLLIRAVKSTYDTIYSAVLSPDGKSVAFGCADKTARIVSAVDGKELLKFENHSDWVFGAMFSRDGTHLVTGGRDGALKLVNVELGQFIDDINASNKGYGGINAIARHPAADQVLSGGIDRTPRLYKIYRERRRDVGNTDFNLVRAYEAQTGSINALAFDKEGKRFAVGSAGGEVRVYDAASGKRAALFQGDSAAVFSIAFRPESEELAVGGFDGLIRVFNPKTGEAVREFSPFPIENKAENGADNKAENGADK